MTCNDIHSFILNTVKKDIKLDVTDEKLLLRYIFKNYRYSTYQHKGIRLSFEGNRLLQKHFESFSYPLSERVAHTATIALDRNMLWPYYIGKQYVTFYSADDASWFQLNGKDLNSFSDYI